MSGVDEIVNFNYFSMTLTEFKDFSRQLLKIKTSSRLYEPCIIEVNKEKKKKLVALCSSELGKSCTDGQEMYKKCDARAELLFCPSKSIAFLSFSLTSSLLKLRFLSIGY